MKSKLEPIYLANILLYLQLNIQDIITFITINKKCQEASLMIRRYTHSSQYKNEIPYNIKTIFPQLETIDIISDKYDLWWMYDLMDLSESFKQLTITQFVNSRNINKKLDNDMKEKIIELKIPVTESFWKYENFIDFPNLRKLTLFVEKCNFLNKFIECTTLQLKQLIICCPETEKEELFQLNINKMNGIGDIIFCFFLTEEQLKLHHQKENQSITSSSQIVFKRDIQHITCYFLPILFDSIGFNSDILIDHEDQIDQLYNHYQFTSCEIIENGDFRKCSLLKSISKCIPQNEDIFKSIIKIDGLQQLSKLVNINEVDTLPPSVTELVMKYPLIVHSPHPSIIDGNPFSYIKILKTSFHLTVDDLFLKPFIHLEELSCNYIQATNEFYIPQTLKRLTIGRISQMKPVFDSICQSTQLEQLSFEENLKNDDLSLESSNESLKKLSSFISSSTQLKELKLSDIFIQNQQLPPFIETLSLYLHSSLDISYCTTLRNITIESDSSECEITLPTNLNQLILKGNVYVMNMDEISYNTFEELKETSDLGLF